MGMQALDPNGYVRGVVRQRRALVELADHADRLFSELPWLTDDVAELHEHLYQAVIAAELDCLRLAG